MKRTLPYLLFALSILFNSCSDGPGTTPTGSTIIPEVTADEPAVEFTVGMTMTYRYVEYDSLGNVDTIGKPFSNVLTTHAPLRDTMVRGQRWFITTGSTTGTYTTYFAKQVRSDGIWTAALLRSNLSGKDTILTGYGYKFPAAVGESYDMFHGYAVGSGDYLIGPSFIRKTVTARNVAMITAIGVKKCYVAEYMFGGSFHREYSTPAIGLIRTEAYRWGDSTRTKLSYTYELVQVKR